MSTTPIDYSALANKYGGTQQVDYSALAAKYGGTAQQGAPDASTSGDTTPPEGFWHSLGAQFGMTPEAAQAAAQDAKAHPIKDFLWTALGPAGMVARSLYDTAKQSGGELGQAYQAAKEGNTAGVAQHAITAVPIVGPALAKGADQYAGGDYEGEAGTLLGASSQAAPAVLAAADAAGVPRPNTSIANVASKVSPSAMKDSAGALLQSVAKDADSIPVQLDNSGDAALRLMDWQNKTQLGPTINKFLNRITKPNAAPLTYSEARDYYQILGKLSADETSKLPSAVQRDLTQMVSGLKDDIGNAAGQVGRAPDYYQGLSDYSKGANRQELLDMAKEAAIKGALTTAGGAAAGGTAYKLWQWLTGK